MNDTVARIVDLMFENVEMNEETAALRDEVMNNCQDRYRDLVEAGVSEDEAVAAVVESLRGMEDVIAQYGRKQTRSRAEQPAWTETTTQENVPAGEQDMVFPASVQMIDVTLISEDVRVEATNDGNIHVCWDADTDPQIRARMENGVLKIDRMPEQRQTNGTKKFTFEFNGSSEDGMNSVFESLGHVLGRVFGAARTVFNSGNGVTIRVPWQAAANMRLVTTSGDLAVEQVDFAEMNIVSTSGDITLRQRMEQRARKVELRTTSGDIEAAVNADSMSISSTSGDVEAEGRINQLHVSTVSGDIDVRADVAEASFKAISGDVSLAFDSPELRCVNGSTISGDVKVNLPDGTGHVCIKTQTRTGDVTTRCNTNGVGPTVTGQVSTMSGDITIR